MKKLLIITYYWPPSAGAGVQRWLKFSKYLKEFGWEPVIYTPLNPEYPGEDPSLSADVPEDIVVLKTKIWEPYRYYKFVTGKKPGEKVQAGFLSEHKKPGKIEKASAWLRGNLFIPDARKFWIKPSVKFLTDWLNKNPVDAMVSNGPPHSMHLIAKGIKEAHDIPWLADFRDPWTQIDFYHRLRLSKKADRKHKALEKEVLAKADAVSTVSPHCAKGLREIEERHVEVVTNGYDPEDFKNIKPFDYDAFSITHLGSMNADRNPVALWKVLKELVLENPFFRENLKIRLIGKTDFSVTEHLKMNGLMDFTEKQDYLPHDQALAEAGQSALLLLALNNTPNVMGIAPGKLYEYLALKRPILCIGPEPGDAASIISETQSGYTANFDNENKMRDILLVWAKKFRERKLFLENHSLKNYSRKVTTKKMAGILDGIVSEE